MNKSAFKSLGAVLTGLLIVAILGFVTDTVLQRIGILPIPGGEVWDCSGASCSVLPHSVCLIWLLPRRMACAEPPDGSRSRSWWLWRCYKYTRLHRHCRWGPSARLVWLGSCRPFAAGRMDWR